MSRARFIGAVASAAAVLTVLTGTAAVAGATAAGAEKLPRVHALTGVRIVAAPGKVIEKGTVVLRDGVIEAAGAEVEPPADARVWDREGLTVYAGLIEPYTVRDAPDKDGDGDASGGERPSASAATAAMIRPDRDVTPYAASAAAAKKLREAGFTTAVVAPAEGILRGASVVLNLGDGPAADNLLRRGLAQNVTFRRNSFGAGYPASLMGAVALVRQTLADARWHADAWAAYERRPAQERPPMSAALAALAPAAAGKQPVVFETGSAVGAMRAAGLAAELGLDAWLLGSGEEYRWLDSIAPAKLPILLPLDYPDLPEVPDDEDDMKVRLEDLRHWDLAPENPARLLDRGLTVAFTSYGLDDPKQLLSSVHKSIERGLDADRALAALTTTPAALLGISDRAGTVEAGKMANLAVVDGDLFSEKPKVREVWIDGRRYEVKESKPAEVEPAGTWELVVTTGDGQKMPVTLTLSGKAGALDGAIGAMGREVPVSSAEVSGSTLEVSFDGTDLGIPGTISFSLEIEGDGAKGSGVAPEGGFTLEGRRTAKPAPEVQR